MKTAEMQRKKKRPGEQRGGGKRKEAIVERINSAKLSEAQKIERHALIMANTGLAIYFAKRFFRQYSWVPKEDIIGYAFVGLIEAIDHYEPRKGAFSTCAEYWVNHEIRRGVDDNERTIRIPVHKVAETYSKGEYDLSTEESFEEHENRSLIPKCTRSLDEPMKNKKGEEGDNLIDFIPSYAGEEQRSHYLKIRELLAFSPDKKGPLSENEWYVLKRVGEDGETCAAVGRELGYRSREMPRMILGEALRKAGEFLRSEGFTPENCFM